jgi:hypothetical protein
MKYCLPPPPHRRPQGRYDTQYKDIQENGTQHNDVRHSGIESYYTQCQIFHCYAKCRYAESHGALPAPLSGSITRKMVKPIPGIS